MSEPLYEYKSDDWYKEVPLMITDFFLMITDVFDVVQASNGDIMVVLSTVLKALAHAVPQNGFPDPSFSEGFEDFRDNYFGRGIHEYDEDEVKKQ